MAVIPQPLPPIKANAEITYGQTIAIPAAPMYIIAVAKTCSQVFVYLFKSINEKI